MGKTPPAVSVSKVDCGNGKRKLVVREREYDALSWHGLKMIAATVVAIVSIVTAVLTAYYTAEASQSAQMSQHAQQLTKVEERQDGREKAVDGVLQKLDKTLTEQHTWIRENTDRLIEVQTTQKMMREHLKEMSEDVKKLGNQ